MKFFLYTFAAFILISSNAFGQDVQNVNWLTFEEAVELNAKTPKPLFIDVYTDWCGWCKKMDANTFQKSEIASELNKDYYPVKFNAEQKESIEFEGNTFKFVASGRRGYHELAVFLLNKRMSYPTVVFLDLAAKKLQPIPGYKTPEQFKAILNSMKAVPAG